MIKKFFNKNNILFYLKECFLIFIITVIVILFWKWIEIMINGSVNKNTVDSIIGLILICSIYLNISFYKIIKS